MTLIKHPNISKTAPVSVKTFQCCFCHVSATSERSSGYRMPHPFNCVGAQGTEAPKCHSQNKVLDTVKNEIKVGSAELERWLSAQECMLLPQNMEFGSQQPPWMAHNVCCTSSPSRDPRPSSGSVCTSCTQRTYAPPHTQIQKIFLN